ncbi:translation initiation factor IF-2 [Geovibrio thiophilus]|uniref:translation initiation factor IF-2 n=1 Tax=Geovibrio thiophilus TaxID=139438 RepID=UPI001F4F9AB6|nr:translation initiation factor IF-2 [Geovibrio thiophilus]
MNRNDEPENTGLDLTEGDSDESAKEDKHSRLNRRQELLQKALERHKRHPRAREVKIKGNEEDPQQPKKISREELQNRKRALEKNIRKVDEQREQYTKDTEGRAPARAENAQESAVSRPAEAPVTAKEHTVSAEKTEAPVIKTSASAEKSQNNISAGSVQAEKTAGTDDRQQGEREKMLQQEKELPSQGDEREKPAAKPDSNERPRYEERRPQGDRPQYGDRRPQGDRPQGDRPQYGDRRPQGDRPQGDRPQYGDRRPQGDRPQGDRPQYGDRRPQGDRPQGDRPQYGDRRPQGDRPQGDRPQYGDRRPQGDRPQGDRPQYGDRRPQGDRPQGDRPQYERRPQGDRPQGDRPQYERRPQGDRPQGDRPQYERRPQGDRPQGDRPQYDRRPQGDRPQGDRPQYGDRRPQGDRPQGDRPQYGDRRPQGDRPQYGDRRPQGDRPQYGDRRPMDKDRGDRPQYGDRRPQRPAASGGMTPKDEIKLEIKKKIKDKPEPQKVEVKKKPVKKADKPKSFHKTVAEGFDELTIEHEIAAVVAAPVAVVEKEEEVDESAKRKPQTSRPRHDKRKKRHEVEQKVIVRPSSVEIGENIIVSDLAKLMAVKATELVKKLLSLGIMASVNQAVDADTAVLLASDYGIDIKTKVVTEEDLLPTVADKPEELIPRPPIVTVMGHVDHGKTSLLDAIRRTSVAEKEAGGITQHIGAYEVDLEHGKIVFLDTPGHEAFTTLRARGAQVTDIVILVVAADDGVMPQTKEAIDHSKAAGVKIVVAVNKIDKENANPDMVKRQLADLGIISEEWGGNHQFQEISAKKNLNIDTLLERVLLEAEMLDLKGNPERPAEGIIIESKLDKQKGPVATVLIRNGSLKKGDYFVCGTEHGKVRAMFNFKGMSVKEAGVSIPVELMGFSDVPQSGDRFIVTPDEKVAKQIAELRMDHKREKALMEKTKVSLADLFAKIKQGELKELNIVLKADVQGSLAALENSLNKLTSTEIKVNIIHSGVGGINENDIILTAASNGLIFGFNVRPDVKAKEKAEKEGVDINLYSVIYQIVDDVKQALEGMIDPNLREQIIGQAEVRQVFSVPKIGKIAGSYVTDGKILKTAGVRVIRNSIVLYQGKISSLKRFKDDAKEVMAGYECGIGVEKFNDLKEGDVIEAFITVEEKRTLDDVKKSDLEKQKAAAAQETASTE